MKNLEKNLFQRNIYLNYIFFILVGFALGWSVVEILYYQFYGLSFFQISILGIIGFIIALLAEVPTGVFADLYGKKKSLVLTSISIFFGCLFFTFAQGFLLLALGTVFFAFAQAFYSGAGSALVFESLKQLNKESEFELINSRINLFGVSTGVLTNFFVPILFELDVKLSFELGLIFSLILIIVSFLFYELPIRNAKKKISIFKEYKNQIMASISIIKKSNLILWFIFFDVFWALGIVLFGYYINQPFIKQNYSYFEYGVIFSIATLIQSFILFQFSKISNYFKKNRYLFLVIIWTIFLPLLLIKNIFLTILVLAFLWSIGSFQYIFIEGDLNKNISSDSKRATILSFKSMLRFLSFSLVMPFFGLLLDLISLNFAIILIAVYSLLVGLIFILIKKFKNI